MSGDPTAKCSYLAGWTVSESKSRTGGKDSKSKSAEAKPAPAEAEGKSGSGTSSTVGSTANPLAGDTVSVRIHGVDQFNNMAILQEGSLNAVIAAPDGTEIPLSVVGGSKAMNVSKDGTGKVAGKTQFEVRQEVILSGPHELRVFLHGEQVKGSPIPFSVLPSAATPQQSRLVAPDGAEALVVDLEKPSAAHLVTHDKYGNACVSWFELLAAAH